MRATIIILFLSSFFCFGSGQSVPNSMDFSSSFKGHSQRMSAEHNNFLNQSTWSTFIALDNELVLLEESCSTDDVPHTFFSLKSAYFKKSYPSFPTTIIIKDNCIGFKNFQTVYGYSQPIYISQQVLRI